VRYTATVHPERRSTVPMEAVSRGCGLLVSAGGGGTGGLRSVGTMPGLRVGTTVRVTMLTDTSDFCSDAFSG
jgi:hypothetical protein